MPKKWQGSCNGCYGDYINKTTKQEIIDELNKNHKECIKRMNNFYDLQITEVNTSNLDRMCDIK